MSEVMDGDAHWPHNGLPHSIVGGGQLFPLPLDHQTPPNSFKPGAFLEADGSQSEDNASDIGSCSITASILDYEFENGRRYHAYKAGHYPLPNDENELERLDLQHHIVTLLLNGELYLAPIRPESCERVLDLGTGTGLWAIELADRMPNTTITGVDLSPIQPIWVPDNVHFEVDDIESEWLHKENYFDYIHSRILTGAIDNWQRLIKRAYKHTKPGGWLEIQEMDPELTSDDATHEKSIWHSKFVDYLVKGAKKYGKCIARHYEFEEWFRKAGFVDVHTVLYKLPMNTWPKDKNLKEIGKYQLLNYYEGYEAISIGFFTRSLGWTANEFQVLLAHVRAELKDRGLHTYKIFAVCYGRKPYPDEVVDGSRYGTPSEARSSPPMHERYGGDVETHPVPMSTDHASVLRPPVPPPLKVYSDALAAHEAIVGRSHPRGSSSPLSPRSANGSMSYASPSRIKSPPPIIPIKPKYLQSNKINSPNAPSAAIPIASLLCSDS